MSHALVEGRVTLLKCVTPVAFWIRCDGCRGSSKIPEAIRRKHYSGEYYPPEKAFVFARDHSDGFFYRGIICGRRSLPDSPHWEYVVQLVDTFQIRGFLPEDVVPTFGEENSSCESAHLVSLLHLLPSIPPTNFEGEDWRMFCSEVREWDNYAHIVERFITENCADELYYEQLSVFCGLSFGRVTMGSEYDLSNYLLRRGLAHRVILRFKSVIEHLLSPVDVPGLLPTFDPHAIVDEHNEESLVKNDYVYDLTKFKVHEDDQELHSSLAKNYFLNVLLTEAPQKNEKAVRFIAPDGTVVLGTVLSLPVHFSRQFETQDYFDSSLSEQNPGAIEETQSRVLSEGLRRPVQMTPDFIEHADECSRGKFLETSLPRVSDSDEHVPNGIKFSVLSYSYDCAHGSFISQGGLIRNHVRNSLDKTWSPVLEFVEYSFDSLGITSMRDWQKVCFPSIISKRNSLIIGPEGEGKLTVALVSILSWINHAGLNCNKLIGVSPILIVIVPNSARATYVADLMSSLCECDIVLLVAIESLISEKLKAEMANRCDILITNPRSLLQLMNEGCCLDGRLSYLLFDSLEFLHKNYKEQLLTIFKAHSTIRTKEVQKVLLSNAWSSNLLDFLPKSNQETTMCCIIDIVEAGFYYRSLPSIAPCSTENWVEQLINTLKPDVSSKRLLLCRDDTEVISLEESLKFLDVRSIHESLNSEQISEIVDWWIHSTNPLLISTDALLESLDFVNDVNLVVSWKGVHSRRDLIRRYRAIKGNPIHTRNRARVSIFYDRHSFEEIIFLEKLMEHSEPSASFSRRELSRNFNMAYEKRERAKQQQFCPCLCGFGSCSDFISCPYRHVFVDEDTVLSADNTQFLVVELLKLHSGFHCSVRIKEIVSNQSRDLNGLGSYVSNLSEIDAQLRKFYSPIRPQSKVARDGDIRVGDVVGVKLHSDDTPALRRAKIVGVDNTDKTCEVMLMDFDEPRVLVNWVDVFKIPARIASYPEDRVDIYMSELRPPDFNCDWAYETRCFLSNLLELSEQSLDLDFTFLAGPVVLQLNRNLIVDSLRLVKYHKGVIVELNSLKNALLKSDLAVRNGEHLQSLSALSVRYERPPLIPDEAVDRFGVRCHLPSGFVPGIVVACDDPGRFYVRLLEEGKRLTDLELSLADAMKRCRQPLNLIASDELCAFQCGDDWNRAIILEVHACSSNEAWIMSVDYGDTRAVRFSELFCLPNEFFSVPYFVIESKLLGVKPIGESYCEEAAEAMMNLVWSENSIPKRVSVKFFGTVQERCLPRYYNHHEVVIKDSERLDAAPYNLHLVLNNQAKWDPISSHLLLRIAETETLDE